MFAYSEEILFKKGYIIKISLHSSGPEEWREIFMKQPVEKYR